jgi:hypothetical protein
MTNTRTTDQPRVGGRRRTSVDELQMIVVRQQQQTYRQQAAEDRLARHIDRVVTRPADGESSHLFDPAGHAPRRLERTLFGKETAAVGYDCCVASAERAG